MSPQPERPNPMKYFQDLKPENKPEVKQEKQDTNERDSAPQVLVSNTDAYIWDRMKAQPKSIEDIDIKVSEIRGKNIHRLSLPEEVTLHEDKYTFRWIFKNKRAIDDACDLKGWILVNRTYFPDLPKHLFTASGSIERGDNILAFMPRKKAEALRREPGIKARQIMDSTLNRHKDDSKFYVPKDEETGDRVIGI